MRPILIFLSLYFQLVVPLELCNKPQTLQYVACACNTLCYLHYCFIPSIWNEKLINAGPRKKGCRLNARSVRNATRSLMFATFTLRAVDALLRSLLKQEQIWVYHGVCTTHYAHASLSGLQLRDWKRHRRPGARLPEESWAEGSGSTGCNRIILVHRSWRSPLHRHIHGRRKRVPRGRRSSAHTSSHPRSHRPLSESPAAASTPRPKQVN